jgi:two-component system cell cycle sensor histidine kinase/response regulator CckA
MADRLDLSSPDGAGSSIASISELSEPLLSTVLRTLQDGIITCDELGKITYVNKSGEKLLGLQKGTGKGLAISDVYVILYESGRVPCENACLKVLKSHRAIQNKRLLICIARDGTERLVFESAAPLFDATRQFCGVIVILREVTDVIDEIRVPNKMESFKTLASGMVNDFNNLLTVIKNSLFMARLDLEAGSEKHQILLNAEKAAVQANVLTNQMLSLAGGGRPVMTEIDIREIITDAAGFIITDTAIAYQIQLDDDLALVSADRGMIDQAIGHVLKNAVQALPDGGEIRVGASNVTVDSSMPLPLNDGEYVRVSISDSGKGIPHENRAKVFDPFFTTRSDGHGLGLSLAYAAVRQHGGHITVDSGAGGTTVSLYLPSLKRSGADKPKKGSGKGRVLFMDDEDLVRRSVERILQYLGFDIVVANNGDETVNAYKKSMDAGQPFDIVILDLIINQGRGGKDVVKEILGMDRDACVVISTGFISDPVVADFKKYGFKGVITKPYNIAELNATLYLLVRKKPA